MGERKLEKKNNKNEEKNSSFGCPLIPTSTIGRPTVFRCPRTRTPEKISRTHPKWEWVV